ncbi:hypothetical protein KP509_24G022800 [Ceratopteris richardii]|nr:hypothetical protein KP509_24G022800 [Ceratopteris richardii]
MGMTFAADGGFFVTAGVNQLKCWSMVFHANRQRPSGVGSGVNSLDARSINVGSLSEVSFVAVALSEDLQDYGGTCEVRPIYALSTAGILCLLHRGLAVKKWVNLKVKQGNSLSVFGSYIACACSNGTVRVFMTDTLIYKATLPHPAPIGFHDLTDINTYTYFARHNVNGISYPDAMACRFASAIKLAVLYADHSLFIWDIQNFSNIQKCYSFLSHSQCVWDIINLPKEARQIFDSTSVHGNKRTIDSQGVFATCSSDGSVRIWDINAGVNGLSISPGMNGKCSNVYDKTTLGVLYQDKQGEHEKKSIAVNQHDGFDNNKGFRSISASHDGRLLAAGDRSGNLHIYDLNCLQICNYKEAHDAEILTLSFGSIAVKAAEENSKEVMLLASGGRDRLVHIYDATRDFEVIKTLDDHSASVTALKFACNGSKLLSSSADKSVVFRNIEYDCLDMKSLRYHQEMASRGTVYDLDVDASRKLVATVGQDKRINFLSLSSGKSVKSFKPDGDSGEPIKVRVDPTGTCVICSHSDKSIRVYDISNGELLCSGQGHSEVITGVIFTADCKRVISVSGDSCIFVWKLPNCISRMMRKKANIQSESLVEDCALPILEPMLELSEKQESVSRIASPNHASSDETDTLPLEEISDTLCAGPRISSAFKFSVSRLPHWAQAKVSQTDVEQDVINEESCSLHSSDSRWVQRLGTEGYKLFCEPEVTIPPATIVPNQRAVKRRFTIEPSASSTYSTPESSLDSQTSGNLSFSPSIAGRKHSHWKTVHTLFFDEEYVEDDAVSDTFGEGAHNTCQFDEEQNSLNHMSDKNTSGTQLHTVSIISMHSHRDCADQLSKENELSQTCMQTPPSIAGALVYQQDEPENSSVKSSLLPLQRSQFSKNEIMPVAHIISNADASQSQGQSDESAVALVDETSDDDESDLLFSPERDLFHSHFSTLSTTIKVFQGQASARSSFSARYFAQSCHPLPVLSLFQDSPLSEAPQNKKEDDNLNECGRSAHSLLSKEREILKYEESQGILLSDGDLRVLEVINRAGHEVPTNKSHQVCQLAAADDCHADDDQCCLDMPTVDLGVSPTARKMQPHNSSPIVNNSDKQSKDLRVEESVMSGAQQDGSLGDEKANISCGEQQYSGEVFDYLPDRNFIGSLNEEVIISDLKRALEDLNHAADRVLNSIRDLNLRSSASKIPDLSRLQMELIPATLQKVWLLSDSMSSLSQSKETISVCDNQPNLECSRNSFSDRPFLRLSNTGENISRPCTAASVAASSSGLESIDIEGFIQNYSVRFSTTLANQVLALVQKGLSKNQ